jgi:hypothetical protein
MIGLEQLADGTISDRNFQRLNALVPDTGGQTVGLRFGVSSIGFTASTDSANTVIAHGLGTTPIVAVATVAGAGSFATIAALNTFSYGATNFSVNGRIPSAATTTLPIVWLVIG